MAYYRMSEDQRVLVAANFGKEAVELELEYPVECTIFQIKIALRNRSRC